MSSTKENKAPAEPVAVKIQPTRVVVHPLVLLSVVDHYNREAKDSQRRVVGALLGSRKGSTVDITNSFAVPFEEDPKKPTVWFLDHNYLETMYRMFRKVNSKCYCYALLWFHEHIVIKFLSYVVYRR